MNNLVLKSIYRLRVTVSEMVIPNMSSCPIPLLHFQRHNTVLMFNNSWGGDRRRCPT